VLLMPNSNHLSYGISNLVSLITKTKLGLSRSSCGDNMFFCLMCLQLHWLFSGGNVHLDHNP
jgi:hypothetical protein